MRPLLMQKQTFSDLFLGRKRPFYKNIVYSDTLDTIFIPTYLNKSNTSSGMVPGLKLKKFTGCRRVG